MTLFCVYCRPLFSTCILGLYLRATSSLIFISEYLVLLSSFYIIASILQSPERGATVYHFCVSLDSSATYYNNIFYRAPTHGVYMFYLYFYYICYNFNDYCNTTEHNLLWILASQ